MSQFPNPSEASEEGLLAVGGELSEEMLVDAYSHGIFPWPQEGYPMLWFSPNPRGILDFKDFRVPKSLAKWQKSHAHWSFTLNQSFAEVIQNCRQQKRPGQPGTWITEEMQNAYTEFFESGHILCMECWYDKRLIGGLYGVDVNGVFSAESMFFKEANASKMCLWKMVEHLQKLGRRWMDIQMVTPVTKSMGGKYIPREEFLKRLKT